MDVCSNPTKPIRKENPCSYITGNTERAGAESNTTKRARVTRVTGPRSNLTKILLEFHKFLIISVKEPYSQVISFYGSL